MSKTPWTDENLERHLVSLSASNEPAVSPALMARTHEQMRRPTRRLNVAVAAAITVSALFLTPVALSAMTGESILGVHVTISDMSPVEWFKQGFSNWLAGPGEPERLSPEETLRQASFPVRVPTWLPEGFTASDEPRGYYAQLHTGTRWQQSEHFGVTQGFLSADKKEHFGIHQSVRYVGPKFTWPPGTEITTVAGHPAFLERNQPVARAEKADEEASRRGELPKVVGHINELTLWVEEADGSITAISLRGTVAPEILEKVAESLFDN